MKKKFNCLVYQTNIKKRISQYHYIRMNFGKRFRFYKKLVLRKDTFLYTLKRKLFLRSRQQSDNLVSFFQSRKRFSKLSLIRFRNNYYLKKAAFNYTRSGRPFFKRPKEDDYNFKIRDLDFVAYKRGSFVPVEKPSSFRPLSKKEIFKRRQNNVYYYKYIDKKEIFPFFIG